MVVLLGFVLPALLNGAVADTGRARRHVCRRAAGAVPRARPVGTNNRCRARHCRAACCSRASLATSSSGSRRSRDWARRGQLPPGLRRHARLLGLVARWHGDRRAGCARRRHGHPGRRHYRAARTRTRLFSARQLYAAGVRIGRDHIASTVNTLVLAYAGASLPLLLLFRTSGQALAARRDERSDRHRGCATRWSAASGSSHRCRSRRAWRRSSRRELQIGFFDRAVAAKHQRSVEGLEEPAVVAHRDDRAFEGLERVFERFG